MNLVQLANDLEFVPKEQLAQMSQDPNSRFPSYLVLSEIQRRTMNEKAYAAAQAPPTTTVAEEVVGEFMQPQGMQAGMPPESAPTDVFSSGMSGMPASAPMQMADGGSSNKKKKVATTMLDILDDDEKEQKINEININKWSSFLKEWITDNIYIFKHIDIYHTN